MRTAKTLIRLGGCPGWAESSLGGRRGQFCWFGGSYESEPCSKKVLNSVSSQCTRGKSSVARKTEVDRKTLKW